MDWVRATLSDLFLRLAARVSASTPTETPPPVSRQPQSVGQSDQHAGGGGPQMAAADDPPPEDFSGFRITLERQQPDGSWQFIATATLCNETCRMLYLVFSGINLLAFAQMSPTEQQIMLDGLRVTPPPEPAPHTVLH